MISRRIQAQGRRGKEGWRGKGESWEFLKSGKQEKYGEIIQQCSIFCSQRRPKGKKPRRNGQNPAMQSMGVGNLDSLVPLSPMGI